MGNNHVHFKGRTAVGGGVIDGFVIGESNVSFVVVCLFVCFLMRDRQGGPHPRVLKYFSRQHSASSSSRAEGEIVIIKIQYQSL